MTKRTIDELTVTDIAPRKHAGPRLVALWNGGSLDIPLPSSGSFDVGRADDCIVHVDHPSISRRHARIHVSTPMAIEDLGSSNGTWINGKRITPNARTPVGSGAVIELGSILLVIKSAEAPAEARSPEIDDAMARLEHVVGLLSKSNISVVLLGETGVGKGFYARRIHAASPRSKSPFLEINCAAVPDALIEGELFGYQRGAFTGATAPKVGLLESAGGGTVFLDEVGDLPLAAQAKLLHVLENGAVMRLGEVKSRPVDVRYICATNRDLSALVKTGAFRGDLFYRLDGFTLTIPSLRERPRELAHLAPLFLAEAAKNAGRGPMSLAGDAVARLAQHDWPGNVRELRAVLARSVLLATGDVLSARDLHFGAGAATAAVSAPLDAPEGDERARILAVLDQCGGNQTRAAKVLGISRRTLVNRLDVFGVPRPKKG